MKPVFEHPLYLQPQRPDMIFFNFFVIIEATWRYYSRHEKRFQDPEVGVFWDNTITLLKLRTRFSLRLVSDLKFWLFYVEWFSLHPLPWASQSYHLGTSHSSIGFFLYSPSEKDELSLYHRRIKYGGPKDLSLVTWAILKKEKKGKIYCYPL